MTATNFSGFGPRALAFFKALDFHQDRDWFQENRGLYEEDVLAPLAAFITDLSAACGARGLPLQGTPKSAIFRIHRDVRFAKDKRPYKTHAGAIMTRSGQKSDPGLFYIHVSPEGCFAATGFYGLEPAQLTLFRQAVSTAPKRFLAMEEALRAAGHAFDPQWSLKRPPREAQGITDPRLLAALKLKSIVVRRPIASARIAEPGLVEDCANFIEETLPLLDFGWAALARAEPRRR
jgi:uncharacterized protein (TIGR02453 family)